MALLKKPTTRQLLGMLALALLSLASVVSMVGAEQVERDDRAYIIAGRLVDKQHSPIVSAHVSVARPGSEEPLDETESADDGYWALSLSEKPDEALEIFIERAHFENENFVLGEEDMGELLETGALGLGEFTLSREITPGFYAAAIIFAALLLIIAFERMHSTTAALLGVSLVFLVSFIAVAFFPSLYIINFERALTYINWEVIFLVMAMMIVVVVVEGTGIFQWTAFQAYRISRGKTWLLILILMAVTAVASALLDNFTTMLLMTPISLQIALGIGINPLALIIPEVLASNVGGISTLIGTPTNILIGAHAGITFTDFLVNQTVGVVGALIVMAAYVLWHYRKDMQTEGEGISPRLVELLKERGQIENPDALKKSGIVFGLVIVGFVVGEQFHVVPAVPALIGATALLVWLRPDVQRMILSVDWTTLVFFMALFMVVGAIQEVGLISFIAEGISQVVGESLPLAIFVIVFGVGTLSVVIANIPLAASMLPVADFLTLTIPGADSKALYYALSMGAAMGGNGTLIGAEANLVTAGITAQAGRPIAFSSFMKVGLPVTFLTLAIGYIWLLIRFVF